MILDESGGFDALGGVPSVGLFSYDVYYYGGARSVKQSVPFWYRDMLEVLWDDEEMQEWGKMQEVYEDYDGRWIGDDMLRNKGHFVDYITAHHRKEIK